MEISDCTSVDLDTETTEFKPQTCTPKGLAGVPHSIEPTHIHTTAPKPNIFKRIAITIGLTYIHFITISIQFSNWILKTFFGYSCKQKVLYRELHHISKNGTMGQIQEFLVKNSSSSFVAGYLFTEFLDLPETHIHLSEILQGANTCLENDKGFFCRRWSEHQECQNRISSHEYQDNECYAIGHFLFWLDLDGNTRFQFENSPLKGFFSSINHLIDYLRYSRDNEQQGVTGTSEHTEEYCLRIEVDPLEFMVRKLK